MGNRLLWGYAPLLPGNTLCRANQILTRIGFQGTDKLEKPLHVCRKSLAYGIVNQLSPVVKHLHGLTDPKHIAKPDVQFQ